MTRLQLFVASACLLGNCATQALASYEYAETASKLRIMNFGVTERLTSQSYLNGYNFSTLLSWNPHYQVTPWLNIEGQFGGTIMNSTLGRFVAGRYQVGVSFHNLLTDWTDGEDRLVPELLAGAETWAVSAGGTYLAVSLNLQYRLHLKGWGVLNLADAIHAGYQWLPGSPGSAQQITFGVRFVPFPEKRIETPIEVAKVEPQPAITPQPAPPVVPVAEPVPSQVGFKDIEKGSIAEILNDGVSITLPGSRVSFETAKSGLSPEGRAFARGFCQVLAKNQASWDRIEIVGHTDRRGNEKRNQKLSLARANSMLSEMKAAGITPEKLLARGAGSREPKDPGNNEAAWRTNRRVVVRVFSKQDGSEISKAINEYDSQFGK